LLKRTAKIETQAGALAKQKVKGKEVLLPKEKDLANAEAENCCHALLFLFHTGLT
jgi:hypothetical protein